MSEHKKRIEYVPPPDKAIEQLVREASRCLAEERDDPAINQRENVDGLIAFVKLVAELEIKRLNRELAEREQAQDGAPTTGNSPP